ncbi:uncharacterized protein LOC143915827 [Arctopsyche grandis]|uniref:uncharacterized protein LOC143915827 n=1 Tax=Arctopsyche grandis TaxID=121162 RepID=UPI00406D9EF5
MPAPTVSNGCGSQAAGGALRLALQEAGSAGGAGGGSAACGGAGGGAGGELSARLSGGVRSHLLSAVQFEEAGSYHHHHLLHSVSLKAKYLLLRPEDNSHSHSHSHSHSNSHAAVHSPGKVEQENSLPSPKRVLFPQSAVRHGWRLGWQVGSGMQNIGNTCYLNSTLQALFHVSAFANWLISENHSEKCNQQNGNCIICGMRKTLIDTQNSGGPIKPWQVYSNLRLICRHLTPGRQEDAHEFLRYLVEAMEKAYVSRFDCAQLDQYSKETTPLNQILGGYLRSVVRCLACGRVSTTFQHFQDLLVDARKASTIDEALETFFSRERLEDLGYKCEFCNKKVSATKQFFIERAPMVLCIALKRFSITGGKLTKHVQFRQRLSLNKFMHNQNSSQQLGYRLVSVVTHLGQSQNCGHYTAVGYGPSGAFYQFDDSCVREISISSVLNTNAYIMFYELCSPLNSPSKNNIKSTIMSSSQTLKESKENIPNSIGPLMLKPLKCLESNSSKSTNTSESNLNLDQERSSPIILKFKPGNITPCKSSVHKLNENGFNDSSKDKSLLSLSLTNSKLCDQKTNGTSNSVSNGQNKITYFNTNGQIANGASSNPQHNKTSNSSIKNSLGNSIAHSSSNGKITNDKNSKISSNGDHKTNGSQYGEQKINNLNKVTNGNHKNSEHKNSIGENKSTIVQKTLQNSSSSANCVINESNSNKTQKKSGPSNGSTPTSLVPYDSDGDNQDDDDDDADAKNDHESKSPVTKATSHGWKVSHENPDERLSSNSQKSSSNKSTNGNESLNETGTSRENLLKDNEAVGQLQRLSHRGYGAPVSTWNGTHAQLNRQVFEDKKSELKRAAEADDEMDRGRVKKPRYNNYNNNKYYNGRHSNYNGFQESQNQLNKWGSKNGFKKFYHHNRNFKHKSRGRFASHYSRHHSNNHYHQQYNRNH